MRDCSWFRFVLGIAATNIILGFAPTVAVAARHAADEAAILALIVAETVAEGAVVVAVVAVIASAVLALWLT